MASVFDVGQCAAAMHEWCWEHRNVGCVRDASLLRTSDAAALRDTHVEAMRRRNRADDAEGRGEWRREEGLELSLRPPSAPRCLTSARKIVSRTLPSGMLRTPRPSPHADVILRMLDKRHTTVMKYVTRTFNTFRFCRENAVNQFNVLQYLF